MNFLLLWLLVGSGAVLYAVLDTSASGAYQSIEALSREQWRWGSLLRGLHRYAADAMVLVVLAHVVREWMLGRFRSFRAASWLTGVPLLLLLFVSAIGGFWLNWDRLGQFSSTANAEWLDAGVWSVVSCAAPEPRAGVSDACAGHRYRPDFADPRRDSAGAQPGSGRSRHRSRNAELRLVAAVHSSADSGHFGSDGVGPAGIFHRAVAGPALVGRLARARAAGGASRCYGRRG